MNKRAVLGLSSRLGQAQRLLDLYYRATDDPYHLEVDDRITDFELQPEDREGAVLLPVTEGGLILNSFVFAVLAHAFRTRGYEPHLLLCYNDLDLCIRKHRSPDDVSTCELCFHGGRKTFEAFGLPIRTIDSLDLDGSNHSFATDGSPVEYRDVTISAFATETCRKFLQKFHINFENDEERSIYRRLLQTTATLVDVAHVLYDGTEYDAVLAQQPVYMYGGVFLDVAQTRSIPALSVGQAWADQRILVGNVGNVSALPQFEDREAVKDELTHELKRPERDAVERVMSGRRDGSAMGIDYVDGASTGFATDGDAITVGMFTNLMWDASIAAETPVFADPYEWIDRTIDTVADRSDVQLVIKVHPAEAIIGTNRGVADEIHSQFDPLPSNVELLPPDTDVNPYDLIEQIDAGLVWNSTIGFEMAYHGVPVVVAGETHYRNLGFTIDPTSKGEYVEWLSDIGQLTMTDAQIDRARRYAYYLFFRKSLPFQYIETYDDSLGGHGMPVTHTEIASDPVLDHVVDRVIADEPVVLSRELALEMAAPGH